MVTSITVPQCCVGSGNQVFLNFLLFFDSKMTLDCRNIERAFFKERVKSEIFESGKENARRPKSVVRS